MENCDRSRKLVHYPIPSYLTARTSRDLIGAEQAGEEHLPGYFIFENEWQSFRTKKDRGTKTENSISRVQSGAVQDSGKSGRHLWQ